MINNFKVVEDEVKKRHIPINLYLGNEIMYEKVNIMNYVEEGFVSTLNDSRYLLFEMSFVEYSSEISEVIYDIVTSSYVPILAHPERYEYVQSNPNIVYKLVKEGCLVQVDQNSILGKNGKKAQEIVLLLLKHKLVYFVASDVHNSDSRKVDLKASYNYLKDKVDIKYLNELYHTNGRKIIKNEVIFKYKSSKIRKLSFLFGTIIKLN
jgi:protein-tyrosine phosphatase